MTVNQALVSDPSLLVNYTTGLDASDETRANFIYDQLVSTVHDYAPSTGIGTASAPYSGTIGTFMRQFISQQGEAANNANNLKQGQDVVLNSLQQRFELGLGRQYRPGDERSPQPAERLRRQRPGDEHDQRHAHRIDADRGVT